MFTLTQPKPTNPARLIQRTALSLFLLCCLVLVAGCIAPEGPIILDTQENTETATGDDVLTTDDAEIDVTDVDTAQVAEDDASPGDNEIAASAIDLDQLSMRATYLLTLDVLDSAGEAVGDIEDVIIDLNSGQLIYAILDRSTVLGLGDDRRPIPFTSLTPTPDLQLALALPTDMLDRAPQVDDEWPAVADTTTTAEVANFWAEEGLPSANDGNTPLASMRDLIGIHAGGLGENLAIVEDFLVNLNQAESSYVVLYNAAGFYDPERVLFVPLANVTLEVEVLDGALNAVVLLAVDETVLQDAPSMDRALFLTVDLLDTAFIEELHTYWDNVRAEEG